MNRLSIVGIAFLFGAAGLEPALAADMQVKSRRSAPAQQQTANWNGGQVGGSNGTSGVSNGFVDPGAYLCPTAFPFGTSCFETPFSFSGTKWSYTVGPFIGYRWQLGGTVLGVEADWSWKKGESSLSQFVPFVCFDGPCNNYRTDAKSGSVSQTWDSSFRARFGWLVTPSTLVYGTAGLALGEIKGTFSYAATAFTVVGTTPPVAFAGSTATANASWSDIRLGGTVGVGVETEIGAGWKARLEYRYTDYGSYNKNIPVSTVCAAPTGCSAPSTNAVISLRESFHTIRVGVGFDF